MRKKLRAYRRPPEYALELLDDEDDGVYVAIRDPFQPSYARLSLVLGGSSAISAPEGFVCLA